MTAEKIDGQIVLKLTLEEAEVLEGGIMNLYEQAHDLWMGSDDDAEEVKEEEEFYKILQSKIRDVRKSDG